MEEFQGYHSDRIQATGDGRGKGGATKTGWFNVQSFRKHKLFCGDRKAVSGCLQIGRVWERMRSKDDRKEKGEMLGDDR